MSRQQVPFKMIAPNAVDHTHLVNQGIWTEDLADIAVTNPKIADSAVTSAKIQDGTIVAGDLASSVLSPYVKTDGTPTFTFGPQTGDWFRIATGDGGLYNITRNKGISFPSGVLSEYPSGAPISKAQLRINQVAAPAGNTSSTSYVAMPAPFGSISFNMSGGILVVWVDMNLSNSVANGGNFLGIQYDSGGYLNVHSISFATANQGGATGFIHASGALSAGAHTLNIGWKVGTGTVTLNSGVYSKVFGVEFL